MMNDHWRERFISAGRPFNELLVPKKLHWQKVPITFWMEDWWTDIHSQVAARIVMISSEGRTLLSSLEHLGTREDIHHKDNIR